jgi:hypothetical protein
LAAVRFQRQHQTRSLPARRNLCQRFERLTGIRRDQKFDLVNAAGVKGIALRSHDQAIRILDALNRHAELGVCHAEVF